MIQVNNNQMKINYHKFSKIYNLNKSIKMSLLKNHKILLKSLSWINQIIMTNLS